MPCNRLLAVTASAVGTLNCLAPRWASHKLGSG